MLTSSLPSTEGAEMLGRGTMGTVIGILVIIVLVLVIVNLV